MIRIKKDRPGSRTARERCVKRLGIPIILLAVVLILTCCTGQGSSSRPPVSERQPSAGPTAAQETPPSSLDDPSIPSGSDLGPETTESAPETDAPGLEPTALEPESAAPEPESVAPELKTTAPAPETTSPESETSVPETESPETEPEQIDTEPEPMVTEQEPMVTEPEPTVPPEEPPGSEWTEAVYLGVADYGAIAFSQAERFRYRFWAEGEELSFGIRTADASGRPDYTLQNRLIEGELYRIRTEDGWLVELADVRTTDGRVTEPGNGELSVRTRNGTERFASRNAGFAAVTSAAGGAVVRMEEPLPGSWVRLSFENGDLRTVYSMPEPADYTPPAAGEPGRRTVLNLLRTAMTPVGTTLYVYGGAWNWEDTGASVQASRLGLPPEWTDFFFRQDAFYSYKAEERAESYYPYGGWNEYYYAGADCSGYLGWVLYNTMYREEGRPGCVFYANEYAARLEEAGCGERIDRNIVASLKPGDLMSMSGHCWLCLGCCSDGSAVIVHSSPTASVEGERGGGVQLSALGDSGCEAEALAGRYMQQYFPEWSKRYEVKRFSIDDYCLAEGAITGLLQWDTEADGLPDRLGPLSDPDGVRELSAEEVLRLLFGS